MVSDAPTPPRAGYDLIPAIATPADVGRLLSELDQLEDRMFQLRMRDRERHVVALPPISKGLEAFATHNKLNLLKPEDRQTLKAFLADSHKHAPRLHLSFSTEPNAAFLEQLLVWLRREISPLVLVTIGLQPTIGAGCTVRSTNKYFDLSLSQTFREKRAQLLEQIVPQVEPPVALSASEVPAT